METGNKSLHDGVILIRPGSPEDMERVAQRVVDMAASHEGMLQYCTMQAGDHRRVLAAGLLKMMAAEAGGRVVGFLLYTLSHSTRHAEPGLYLQSLYVDEEFRRHRVGQSLLAAVARHAVATGCGHLKLMAQAGNYVVDWYRRLGFQVLTESEDLGFLELIDADQVAAMLTAGEAPLPADLSLQLRDCDTRLPVTEAEAGKRFELTCSACDCSLRGTAALTYCMWQGPVLQMDMEAVRPSCRSPACALMTRSALHSLIGRCILLLGQPPLRPGIVWIEVVRCRPEGLAGLLASSAFEDNSANEHWLIFSLSGRPLAALSEMPISASCRVDPALSLQWDGHTGSV